MQLLWKLRRESMPWRFPFPLAWKQSQHAGVARYEQASIGDEDTGTLFFSLAVYQFARPSRVSGIGFGYSLARVDPPLKVDGFASSWFEAKAMVEQALRVLTKTAHDA